LRNIIQTKKSTVQNYKKIFNVTAKGYGNQTKNVIRNRLLAATRQEFDELLEVIDISRYVFGVIKEKRLRTQKEYGEYMFISGNNIVSLEIISLETGYALHLMEFSWIFMTIPKSVSLTDPRLNLKYLHAL
jgi:hypothetical protein